MMYSHTCIKCHQPYQDEDIDDYYCASCVTEVKAIAAEIDLKRASSAPQPKMVSEIEAFMNDPRTVVKNGGRSIFIRESQL